MAESRFIVENEAFPAVSAYISRMTINAEDMGNMPEMEMQWAVKAMDQAETYSKLLRAFPPTRLRLTKYDDELYVTLKSSFPNLNLSFINEEELKSDQAKAAWREFIQQFEKKLTDFNFGTLLRLDPTQDYTEQNSIFVTRTQFYAIEVARNRDGLNDTFYNTHKV